MLRRADQGDFQKALGLLKFRRFSAAVGGGALERMDLDNGLQRMILARKELA
jgi:hypothetical protein